jgi:hypothetical protein
MAIKRYDVVAVTGSYTDRNGVEKRRYMNCGAIFETEKGLSLKIEALPVAFDGWFQLYEPRAEQQQPAVQRNSAFRQPASASRQAAAAAVNDDFEDDIPF